MLQRGVDFALVRVSRGLNSNYLNFNERFKKFVVVSFNEGEARILAELQ